MVIPPPVREIVSTITVKGQVTIPAAIRRHLGVRQSGKVAFLIDADGAVRIAAPKYPDIESVAGAAGSLERPLSWKEQREIALEDHAAEITAAKR